MATPAQIAANQANARQSTGPRTQSGKAVTRQNASRHGLCSSLSGLFSNDARGQALLADLIAEHQPQGPTEEILVYKMAEQFMLSRRASRYLEMYTDETRDSETSARRVALFLRYYTTADRAFNKNLNELRRLQKERRQQEAAADIGSVSQNLEPAATVVNSPSDPPPPAAPKPFPVAPLDPVSVMPPAAYAVVDRSAPQKQAA